MAGVNPVYDAPASLKFAEALAKVPFVVSLNDRLDETSLLADVLAPASHPFECWGDATLPKGLVAIQQPVIQPLFDTRGLLDILVEWGAAVGDPAALAAVTAASAAAAKAPVPGDGRSGAEPERRLALSPRRLGRAAGARSRDAGVRDGVERGAEERGVVRPSPAAAAPTAARPARPPAAAPTGAGKARRPASAPRTLRRARSSMLGALRPPRLRRASSCSCIRTSRWRTGARPTTAGSTNCPIRSPASPGAGRCRSRRAGSTR